MIAPTMKSPGGGPCHQWQLQHRYLSLEPLADLGQGADEDQILLVPPAAAPILTPRSA